MSTSLVARIERVAVGLREAAALDLHPFGAEGHGWRLNAPLTEADVAAVEAHYGVHLPEDYRLSLTRIGDGGAGPGYGLFPLREALRHGGPLTPRPPVPPEFLKMPFPHTAAWNPETDPAEGARWDALAEGDEEGERRLDVEQAAGTLLLADEGCGYLHLLVVTGPTRGQVWIDARGADAGFVPLGVPFLTWVERWLDGVLAGGRGTWWLDAPPA